jgi:hypothetical protein
MTLNRYFDNLEPTAEDAEIWRFMPLKYFEDLMANEELHFCRADLFRQDETEGIPPENYVRRVMRLRRFDPTDELELINQMGTLAQDREAFYVSCWHLYRHETLEMWQGFAKDGVAIRSQYNLLKSIMESMLDMAHMGLMRYGDKRLYQTGKVNVLQFINTKRKKFESEQEARAILWCPDPFDGGNRHFDINNVPHPRTLPENERHHWVANFKRRRIDTKALITGVIVSPFAETEVYEKARQWVEVRKHSYSVERSALAIP